MFTANAIIGVKIIFKDVVRDGVTYYEIKDYKVNHKYGDKVSFVLTNLFKGNPELSKLYLFVLKRFHIKVVVTRCSFLVHNRT